MIEIDDAPTVDLVRVSASDTDVARAAWVSTLGEDAREKESNRVPGLINYLMRERHGSPFEHNSFTFLISTPIFVTREFHRHRAGWSYNEWSGRYSEMKPHFYIPNAHRKLIQVGKPGAYVFSDGTTEQYDEVVASYWRAYNAAWKEYEYMLSIGVAKEVARVPLPLGLYTTFYATCNSRSLMHFLGLRTESPVATNQGHPLHEIQQVADKMEAHFANSMPLTHQAWNDNGRVCP